jgi:zinc transport system permease protein
MQPEPPPDADPDLAELEAAIAEDAEALAAPDDQVEGFDHDHEDHHLDHSHESHHGAGGLEIEGPDAEPTWSEIWELFDQPIIAAGIAGAVLGFLSVYVVLRRMVFVSAAVTQSAGFGVAASFYVAMRWGWAIDPVWGATAMSLVTAALVAPDPRRLGLSREMVLGLLYALYAGGTVLASARAPHEAHDVQAILFGSAVVVDEADLHRLAISGSAVMLVQLWWFRGIAFASFDPLAARVQGLPVRLLDVVLLVSIGVMVGDAARTLGALPAFAFSVLPGVAAIQVARGPLIVTFAIAAVIGAAAGVLGFFASVIVDMPVGATQTVLAAAAAIAAVAVAAVGRLVIRK